MHLSRLLLNPRSNDVRRDLGNIHNLHRRVMSAFEDGQVDEPRAACQTLFRLDPRQDGSMALLIQSAPLPDWSRLPSDYLLQGFEPNPGSSNLAPIVDAIAEGGVYRFRLRANPTKRLRTRSDVPGKRVELSGHETLLAWFERKSMQAGFRPAPSAGEPRSWDESVAVHEEAKVRGRRGQSPLTFGSVLFEGVLEVTNPATFTSTLKQGLGPAKSYGFGLLSLAAA